MFYVNVYFGDLACIVVYNWGKFIISVKSDYNYFFLFQWTLLMSEGILAVIRQNIFTKRLKHPIRLRVHWITLSLAISLIIAGFAVIIYNRASGDGQHFSTEHGLSGVIATIFAFVTAINGLPVLYSAKLREYLPPNINKLIHGFLGFATIVTGTAATITGYYTGWFQNRSTESAFIVCFLITVIISIWLVVRPVINQVNRSKMFCN